MPSKMNIKMAEWLFKIIHFRRIEAEENIKTNTSILKNK